MNATMQAGEIRPDTAAAPCAACKTPATAVEGQKLQRQGVKALDGPTVLLMLCLDATACCQRYRAGLAPAGYAAMVKRGDRP